MANLFNFRRSLFGFKKKDVENHINNLNEAHANKIKEKELENKTLVEKYNKMEQMYNEAIQKLGVCTEEKDAAARAVTIALSDLATTKTELAVSVEREKMLSAQVDDLVEKVGSLEELKYQKEVLVAEKERIAQAWIVSTERAEAIIKEANEKASAIVNDAIVASESEKKAIEVKIDVEREKLVDIKREMRDLKESFVSMLHKYGEEIDSKISGEQINDDIQVEIYEQASDLEAGIPDLPSDFGKALRIDVESETNNVLSFSDFMGDNDDTSMTVL